MTGRDWGQEENGTTEDEMAGWHHQLDSHEFGWTLGAGDGQRGLACCDSWGRKKSDMIERLNWTEMNCYTINLCSQPWIFFYFHFLNFYFIIFNWSLIYPQYYVSSRCASQWFDISIHYKMITTISLVTIYYHATVL